MYPKARRGALLLKHMAFHEGETVEIDSINLDYFAAMTFNTVCQGDILFTLTLKRKTSRVLVEVVTPTLLLVLVSWVKDTKQPK